MNTPPPVLYKFLSPQWIHTLPARLLRFTPPDRFNDPFEALPQVAGVKRESVARQLRQGEDLDELMIRAVPFFQENGPQMSLQLISETFGVLCLSGSIDNPLLWAHYSSGHEGFAIGFSTNHSWFQEAKNPMPPIDGLQQVTYSKTRPSVTVGNAADFTPDERKQQAAAMLSTKHVAWEYEQEWRLIRPLADADEVVPSSPAPNHLYRYPPEAIEEIVLGARISSIDFANIESALKEGSLDHVCVRQARRSRSTYDIEIG